MYNGIGLQTPRGSGTNGYIQRNLGFARTIKKKEHRFDPAEEEKRLAKLAMARKPDEELIEHNRLRAIEVAVEEWAEEIDLYSGEYVFAHNLWLLRAQLLCSCRSRSSTSSFTDAEIETKKAEKRLEIQETMRAKAAAPKKRGDSAKAQMFGQYAEA